MYIELLWSNPLSINIETPEGEEGKHGIFAFVYDQKEIIYIGKSIGSMHLYQESKNRYRPLGRAFEKLGLLHGNASNEEKEIIERDYCEKYVAELAGYNYSDEDKYKLENAEKLLVFVKQPKGNVQYKKKYSGVIPIRVTNKGPIVGELLSDYYEI